MNLVVAEKLAKTLIQQHLGHHKTIFRWTNAKRTFGTCTTTRNGIGDVIRITIALSKPLTLINDEEKVRDTILHEIAHGLTPGNHHGEKWKAACVRIGAKPNRCYSSEDTNTPKMKYEAVCGGCNEVYGKMRMTERRKTVKSACRCQNNKSWDEKIILEFKQKY